MSDEYGNRDPLSGPWVGCHDVQTRSGSRYFIDLDLMLLQRMPSTEDDDRHNVGAPSSVPLRRDYQRVKILRLYLLAVGFPAIFDLEPLGDPGLVAFTRRSTTEVISISPIERWQTELNAEGKGS